MKFQLDFRDRIESDSKVVFVTIAQKRQEGDSLEELASENIYGATEEFRKKSVADLFAKLGERLLELARPDDVPTKEVAPEKPEE